MPDIKIHLKTHHCDRCHALFRDGDLVWEYSLIEKFFCKTCADIMRNLPGLASSSLIPPSDYVVEGDEGKLRLDSSFEELDDGIYEVKQIGIYLAVNAASGGDTPIGELISINNYLFEKLHKRYLLFFHPRQFIDRFDFCGGEKYSFIRSYFWNNPQFGEAYWLCDGQNRIVGIGNVRGADFKLSFADERFSIAKVISCEELDQQFNNKDIAFNQSVHKAFKNLSPKSMLDYCEERIQGQGIWLKRAVYQIYRYTESVAQGKDFRAENWILTAPSGSGKTEFYRTIKALFNLYHIPVPVVCIDLSQITETGFKGDNVATIPRRILSENPEAKGIAICFLDEADKKCIPSYTTGQIDVNAAVQANLLTLIEGSELKIELDDEQKDFNSNHTMFVLMGTFQSIRQQKQKRQSSSPVGFCSEYKKADLRDDIDQVDDSFFGDLSLQDMIDYGMREELAGRMVQVVNFHRLSREDMLKLIKYKTAEISEEIGINIEMTEDAAKDFLDISFGSLGVRRPMNIIRELVQNAVAEVFFDGKFDINRDKVIIDSTDTVHIEQGTPHINLKGQAK